MSVPCDDRVPNPLGKLSRPRAAKKKKGDPGSEAGVTVRGRGSSLPKTEVEKAQFSIRLLGELEVYSNRTG